MSVKQASESNFQELINNGTTLVDFYADWCGPCQAIAPILDELGSDDKYNVVKVNIDDCPEIAGEFGVISIPTLIVFKDGVAADKKMGVQSLEDLKVWMGNN